ncbi:mannose-1-phosphate guanylyltransferase/mannose-6-phosphate isomerase [Rosenbergiella metrosideri]|uniref:mannose-1-phosphate guanylyltransferase/mannose-6-phosphate isomerase n=1 Tax=Rosenbergiella metrosideri TaxID=2921185 RepID=UPI001F4F6A28|nr:mannose-1-phosphate guanylyltransferase/mannose-6-phosphate isomerase [Rosenbergiella metrosideri]
MILPVIMAGGTGSRLWPLSREHYPKQFLSLDNSFSMLQNTIQRLDGVDTLNPLVICNQEHRFLVAEQLRKIDKLTNNILLEPVGRNTAPAVALAALKSLSKDNDPIILVLAADHVIDDTPEFHSIINKAIEYAKNDKLVTFGIVPKTPETGYGYIKRGQDFKVDTSESFYVDSFVEKPDIITAQSYIESGEYYWNSGMFMFKASKYIAELNKYRPDILSICEDSINSSTSISEFINIPHDIFKNCPDESIDYAVMEKTKDAVVISLDAGWNDVGSWSALWDVSSKDNDGNTITGDVWAKNSYNCYINSDNKFVATIGINNLVVVNTKDAVLVMNKDESQDVKKIVEYLKSSKRREHIHHCQIYRPWGHSDNIDQTPRFNINKVTVKPGGAFSLQLHHHRVEHWVILSGTAKVSIDEKEFLLTENQSTFIPIGVKHSLTNPGKIPLEILEIQSGSYLASDDIIRIKDQYGRCDN